MKKYIIGLVAVAALVFGGRHLVSASESPFPDWFVNYFNNETQYPNSFNQLTQQKLAHGTYSFSIDGGGTIGTAIPIHVVLPPKAIVSRVYYFVTTGLTVQGNGNGATGNMGLGCNNGGGEFKALGTDRLAGTSSASFVEGIPTGTAATMIASSSSCVVGMVVQSSAVTAGKVDFYINYSVSQ